MSKSVKLSTSPPSTGTAKNKPISPMAGATKAHPAQCCRDPTGVLMRGPPTVLGSVARPWARSWNLRGRARVAPVLSDQPATLLEDAIDGPVERGERRVGARVAEHHRSDRVELEP